MLLIRYYDYLRVSKDLFTGKFGFIISPDGPPLVTIERHSSVQNLVLYKSLTKRLIFVWTHVRRSMCGVSVYYVVCFAAALPQNGIIYYYYEHTLTYSNNNMLCVRKSHATKRRSRFALTLRRAGATTTATVTAVTSFTAANDYCYYF